MAKVIIVSTVFPKYHKRAGHPTFFVEKIWTSFNDAYVPSGCDGALKTHLDHYIRTEMPAKHHTIRGGKRWKTGDMGVIRVWSGVPYGKDTTQINISPDVMITVKDVEIDIKGVITVDGKVVNAETVAKNDGLSLEDLCEWFLPSLPFVGQMLIWSPEKVNY